MRPGVPSPLVAGQMRENMLSAVAACAFGGLNPKE